LPDGSVYQKTYDAAAKLWTATLTIPGTPGFTTTASGSFRAEVKADRMYRDWLKQQPAK
jgi:hypothetical protein